MSGINGTILLAVGKVGNYCIYQETPESYLVTYGKRVLAHVGSLKSGKQYIREHKQLIANGVIDIIED